MPLEDPSKDFVPKFPHFSLLWEDTELVGHELHTMFCCSSWNLGMNLQAWDSPSSAFCSDLGTGARGECPCVDFSVTGQTSLSLSPALQGILCVCLPADLVAQPAGTAFSARGGRVLIAWIIVFILRNSTREDPWSC